MKTIKSILFAVFLALPLSCGTRVDHFLRDERAALFNMINAFRNENKVPPLRYLTVRQVEVNSWARHLEDNFEHAKRGFACENIAVNYEGAKELFYQWKLSPGHRRNMLLPNLRYCTIGLHKGRYRNQAGAFFGVFRGYHRKLKAVRR